MELTMEDSEEEEATEDTGEDDDMEEQVDQFFADLDLDHDRQKRRLMKQGAQVQRRRSVLPHHLHSVMGSANLSLARGDLTGATELCMEVIRQAPHVPEPFLTLATIYEDQGDKERLLQILLIAAHLRRSDAELWERVGYVAIERKNPSLAAQCFSKACRYNHSNATLLWQTASLYREIGDHRKAIEKYEALLRALPRDGSPDFFEATKELAKLYHKANLDTKAVDMLQNAVSFCPSGIDDEFINLLSDLLITDKCYEETYKHITRFYGLSPSSAQAPPPSSQPQQDTFSLSAALTMSMRAGDDLEPVIESLAGAVEDEGQGQEGVAIEEVPDDMSVDLRAKLIVCMINMNMAVAESLLSPLTSTPEEYGDLILDIAEAYIDNDNNSKALPLLSALVNTETFNQAEVWLKHAECLHALNELESAAMSYTHVLSLAPHHTETRLTLASLYNQMGYMEDALALLDTVPPMETNEVSQEEDDNQSSQPQQQQQQQLEEEKEEEDREEELPTISPCTLSLDIRLLLTKFTLLANEERERECAEVGCELLAFYFRHVYNRNDLRDLVHYFHSSKLLRSKLKAKGDADETEKVNKEQESLVTTQEWWKVFIKTCRILFSTGQKDRLQHMVICAHVGRKFEENSEDLLLFSVGVFATYSESSLAFNFLKRLCMKENNLNNAVVWNLFNVLPASHQLQKFVLRLMFKHSSNSYNLMTLRISANYSLLTGSYKFTLSQYEVVYRQRPDDYLLCLSIAAAYLNITVQKHTLQKNALVLQAVSFLHKYVKLRGICQESLYNTGRLFHQLGLLHIAVHYYKRVLITEIDRPTALSKELQLMADMRKEAAFNLYLLYRHSGNMSLGLHYLHRYCIV